MSECMVSQALHPHTTLLITENRSERSFQVSLAFSVWIWRTSGQQERLLNWKLMAMEEFWSTVNHADTVRDDCGDVTLDRRVMLVVR